MTHSRLSPFSAFQHLKLDDHRFKESMRLLYSFIKRLTTYKEITYSDTPYTFAREDFYIRIDCTNGNIILNLPPTSDFLGDWVVFKKIDASANTATITARGTELIDGASTKVLSTQYDAVQLYCPEDGTWDIIGT